MTQRRFTPRSPQSRMTLNASARAHHRRARRSRGRLARRRFPTGQASALGLLLPEAAPAATHAPERESRDTSSEVADTSEPPTRVRHG